MKFCRSETRGKVVVLCRKTLDPFPRVQPLKNRTNIILSHNPDYKVKGAIVCHRVEEVLEELKKYPVLSYPHPLILTKKRAKVLKEYVKAGGKLIIGARTGQKDKHGHCVMEPMPGLLTNVSHTDVKEFTFVGPADDPVSMDWNGKEIETGVFNDILAAAGDDVEVLAKYTSNYYAGRPALIRTNTQQGYTLHFGGTFTRQNVTEFLTYTGVIDPWKELIELPADCEIAVREKNDAKYIFVLNYSSEKQNITLKTRMSLK